MVIPALEPLGCKFWILLPATYFRVSWLVTEGARMLASRLSGLLLLSSGPSVPFDVAPLATVIALLVGTGVVSSGLLLVAPFLLGVNTPIRVISSIE